MQQCREAVEGQSKIDSSNIVGGKRKRGSAAPSPSAIGNITADFIAGKKPSTSSKRQKVVKKDKKVRLPYTANNIPIPEGDNATKLVEPVISTWWDDSSTFRFWKVVGHLEGGKIRIREVSTTRKGGYVTDYSTSYMLVPVWNSETTEERVVDPQQLGMKTPMKVEKDADRFYVKWSSDIHYQYVRKYA